MIALCDGLSRCAVAVRTDRRAQPCVEDQVLKVRCGVEAGVLT